MNIFKLIKEYKFIIIVFTFLIAMRFVWIDRIPPGMLHDEIEYALSSKTYQLFGTDLSGISFPSSLIKTNTLGSISPIPSLFFSPLWNILPLNILTIRIVYVLLNIATSLVLGWFIYSLFKRINIAFLGVILFLLNPWSLFLSRHAIDAVFSLFFYLLGTTILITLRDSKKVLITSFLIFTLGFFSYNGAKLLLLPIIGIVLFYKLIINNFTKKKILEYILYFSIVLTFAVGFVLVSKLIPDSIYNTRSGEISFLNNDFLSGNVNNLRNQIIYTPLSSVYINKFTVGLNNFILGYFSSISPQQLFATGEVFRYHGFFYFIDFIYLIIGSYFLYKYFRKVSLFLICLFIIAPIASASSLNGVSILNRSFLILPIFLVVITIGIYHSYILISKKSNKIIAILLITIPYLFLFSNLLFSYFYQFPIHEHGYYQTSTRVLARYLLFESKNVNKIVIVSNEPRQLFLETVFYSPNSKQIDLLKQKQTIVNKSSYSIDNVTFVRGCPKKLKSDILYVVDKDIEKCIPKTILKYLIIDQMDAGENYKIFGGKTCDDYNLSRWVNPHFITDYKIESLEKKQFCERWIAKN